MNKEHKTSETKVSEPAPAPAQAAEHAKANATAPAAETAGAPVNLDEIQKQAAKAAEHWDRLLRTTADFENFRKRSAREKQEAIKYANESLLEKLVPVLDSFDAALTAAKANDAGSARALQQGIDLVFQQLKKVLNDAGLEEVNAAGAVFDPNLHEAISVQESADVPEDHVLVQVRKGYKLRDRLLRPASVVVAKSPKH